VLLGPLPPVCRWFVALDFKLGAFVYKMLAFSSFFWVCCWHLLPSVIFGTYNFGFLR
jgi:hypothetical protein